MLPSYAWREVLHRLKHDYETSRAFFYVLNIVLLVLGAGSLVAGVTLYLNRNDFVELTPSNHSPMSSAGLCVFIGICTCIISLIGCGGAQMESKCVLVTYVAFMVLLALVQLVTGSLGFFSKESANLHVRQLLTASINRTFGNEALLNVTNGFGPSWDNLQQDLECCGVDGPEDWFYARRWPAARRVPDSCCDDQHFSDGASRSHCGHVNETLWYKEGCLTKFSSWLYSNIRVVALIALIVLSVEVVIIVATILLLLHVSRRKRARAGSRDSEQQRRDAYRYTRGTDGRERCEST